MSSRLSLLDSFKYIPQSLIEGPPPKRLKEDFVGPALTLAELQSQSTRKDDSSKISKRKTAIRIAALPPICAQSLDDEPNFPLLVILGSCPSNESLRLQQYYAHPQNHFWPIMSNLLGISLTQLAYQERERTLTAHRICVWDVLAGCSREGSSDASIRNVQPNDFGSFFSKKVLSKIKWIVCNGSTAHRLFKQHGERFLSPNVLVKLVPSTSPANARANAVASKTIDWKNSGVDWDLLSPVKDYSLKE
jgi:TDG/mug DNA glycosylase family protein